MRGKSRHIPIDKYLDCLSVEWFGAMVCHRILPSKKDKDYWKRVMTAKEFKIRDIAERNVLKSIFTDREVYVDYHSRRSDSGIPIYVPTKYINTYYKSGRSVTCFVKGVEQRGTIVSFDAERYICSVNIDGEVLDIHVSGISVIV